MVEVICPFRFFKLENLKKHLHDSFLQHKYKATTKDKKKLK